MNTLIDMNPWKLLDALFDANNRVTRTMRARAAGRFPPVNVFLDDDAVLIDMELPGKTAKDVDLTLEAQAVVVSDKPAPVAPHPLLTERRAKQPRPRPPGRAASSCRSASTPKRRTPNSPTASCVSNCPRPRPRAYTGSQ